MLKTIIHAISPGEDAITLLKADHRTVDGLFKEFENASNKRTKVSVAARICRELEVHDYLESKIFYPATKEKSKNAVDDINEGIVEHDAIRRLIKEIPTLDGTDEFFVSKVTVLMEYVKHHVREEESSMFPKIIESKVDLEKLGERMATAKATYLSKLDSKVVKSPNSKATVTTKTRRLAKAA